MLFKYLSDSSEVGWLSDSRTLNIGPMEPSTTSPRQNYMPETIEPQTNTYLFSTSNLCACLQKNLLQLKRKGGGIVLFGHLVQTFLGEPLARGVREGTLP